MDVIVHPDFASNQWIYLSAAVELDDKRRTPRVYRYRLAGNRLHEQKQIFEARPAGDARNHFGGAMLFDNDGLLYITMGDRKKRKLAQDLSTSLGKVQKSALAAEVAAALLGSG